MKWIKTKRTYNWHAVYLRYRTEKKVYGELLSKGIDCYLPLRVTRRVWSDRVKTIEEPLLPGYVFVRVSIDEYYDVLLTTGVLRYVTFENKPAVIPECQIQALKSFLEYDNSGIKVSTERIVKGNVVKITSGPLKGVVGEVVNVRGKKWIMIRFEKLGYAVQVDLGLNEIEILKDPVTKRRIPA